jgi:hypothetical protein
MRGLKLPGLLAELEIERMREQLNSNPLVQLAVVGVLLVGAALFFMSSSGGGEEESAGSTETTVGVAGTDASGTATGETPAEAVQGAAGAATKAVAGESPSISLGRSAAASRPLPRPVLDAWSAGDTLVLLFIRDGGIDDRRVKAATDSLAGFPDAAVFVVPAAKISRYAAIAEGVGVDRVPALVVVTPKHLKKTVPTASVRYGFQSAQSVAQAVIDAGYEGKTLDYHP